MSEALKNWGTLVRFVNGRQVVGDLGVRDPEYPCEGYDARGYNGEGRCLSDGHYECVNCSQLSPEAPRFTDPSWGRDGRKARLLLFWRRTTFTAGAP